MKSFSCLLATLILAGCAAHSHTEVKYGRKGLHISCSGLNASWDQCEQSANEACPRGYRMLAKSGQDSEDERSQFLFGINPAGFSSRSMIVMCR